MINDFISNLYNIDCEIGDLNYIIIHYVPRASCKDSLNNQKYLLR